MPDGDVMDERPDSVGSSTQRIETGWGEVYVTVTVDPDGAPLEVFVTTGMSGGLFHAQAEAIGKCLSVALRMSGDRRAAAEQLASSLIGIRTDRVDRDSGDRVLSVPDAVGIALRRHARGAYGEPVKEKGDVDEAPEVQR